MMSLNKMFGFVVVGALISMVACSDPAVEEAELKAKLEQQKQDSIQLVLESLRQREKANKDLIKNVRQMCEYQLLALENASPEDSSRLGEFTSKMKQMYPNSDRNTLRRIAMNLDPCEEFRIKAAKKRKK